MLQQQEFSYCSKLFMLNNRGNCKDMTAWSVLLPFTLMTVIIEAKQNKRIKMRCTGIEVNMKQKIQPLMWTLSKHFYVAQIQRKWQWNEWSWSTRLILHLLPKNPNQTRKNQNNKTPQKQKPQNPPHNLLVSFITLHMKYIIWNSLWNVLKMSTKYPYLINKDGRTLPWTCRGVDCVVCTLKYFSMY